MNKKRKKRIETTRKCFLFAYFSIYEKTIESTMLKTYYYIEKKSRIPLVAKNFEKTLKFKFNNIWITNQ